MTQSERKEHNSNGVSHNDIHKQKIHYCDMIMKCDAHIANKIIFSI